MRIDKLELIGFKSFGERTSFNFHPGITCIVGPNGCGKSNIVDAFRWVLGEQSAKSLRGEKMEEVIFNGSVSKKPRGMSEVTLAISGLNSASQAEQGDNGEGSGDTVAVTRRLYRSGDSEYLMNKSQCRLKDIKDLFLDTGLEVRSYSILEQDRIAEILNAKPLERRFLIEEVAGVMKYNVRKKEALSKLDSSRANLQRINDIIIEVKKQISFLDRLAKKAERYKKLISEIHAIELKLAKRDFESLRKSFQALNAEYHVIKEEDALKRADLSKFETAAETRRLQLLEMEKQVDQVQDKFQNLEREIADIEKSIAVAGSEADNYSEYLSKLYQQKDEFGRKGSDFLIRKHELEQAEIDLHEEIQRQKELLEDKADFIRAQEEELSDKEELLEGKRREIFKISEELSFLRNNQNKLQAAFENLRHREETSQKDSEHLKKILGELDASLKDLEANLLERNNDIMLLRERKEIKVKEAAAANNRMENLRETLSRVKEELASHISRIDSLREIVFDESAQELLSGEAGFHMIAAISDVIEVEDEYEKAIESVLSEKVNSFVLSSYHDIEHAIKILKDKGLGRTAFFPADAVHSAGPQDEPEGVRGRASTFLKAKAGFTEIALSLFQNVFVVPDLKTALTLIAANKRQLYVTMDGDVVEPSGAVIAGEIKGIFKRKREIRELEGAVENSKNKIQSLQAELNAILHVIDALQNEIKGIEATIIEREKEVSLKKLTADNYREEKERRSRKLAYLSLELEQIMREKESLEKQLAEKEAEIQSADLKRGASEEMSANLHEEVSQKRAGIEEYRSEATEIRLEITSLKERGESVSKERENIAREISESARKQEFLAEEITSVKSRIVQRQEEIKVNEEKLKSLVTVADEYRQEISRQREIISNENHELLEAEHELKGLRAQIETFSRRISELDVQKAEHRLKMEALTENIRQNYGLAIDALEADPFTEEDEIQLAELRQKAQELGPVNLGTIEEYEELSNRYEFLKNQQDDLHKSIAELEEAIAKINVTTRKKLRDAFEALRTKFAEVFLKLFGGGKAELVMTDENNILETGIDIIAQPPGKRLQNISLLSGGEKALTALSILFASFLIKPTPLCILDEADSALDEMNTDKFAKTVKELSKDTQFIVVTHNRNTVSIADYIYGITMEEAGISKVISMQLVEA